MPGMGGIEATRRLRELGSAGRVVVIAVSASVFGHHREECVAAGADDFLGKPFRLEELLELLCRYLGLEPVHDGEAATPGGPPARDGVPAGDRPPVAALPPDVLVGLLEHARRGDIRQVLEHAGRIAAGDPRHAAFAGELEALARTFQVNKLCQTLERELAAQPPPRGPDR
jgi:CheY-like chemotaxis protein